jgi:hypothetical protein
MPLNFGADAGAGASLSTVCRVALTQASTLSPLVVAFIFFNAECDKICVAHSLFLIPGNMTALTGLDDHMLLALR